MKHPFVHGKSIFVAIVLAFFAEPARAEGDAAKAIRAQGKIFMDAAARGDSEGIAGVFAPDAKLLVARREGILGQKAIQAFWKSALDGRLRGLILKTVDLDGEGAFRIETGEYRSLGVNGEELDRGKYVIVWRRVRGKWMIHRDIANSSLPGLP